MMEGGPYCGLSAMPEQAWLEAALPMLENDEVELLEWSFDCGWSSGVPSWLEPLLAHYSSLNRLTGHGVSFSLLSVEASDSDYHQRWLANLERECSKHRFLHLTEHFGFMRSRNFHQGAPLPIRCHPELVTLGQARLVRIQEIAQCPVGLENLALALCSADVTGQAAHIEQLLAPIDGFFLVDLHNLYCQAHNFSLSLAELFSMYPLERVCELHLSGGSWAEAQSADGPTTIRRDTHDEQMPRELLDFLPTALSKTPNLRAVVFEQLGSALTSATEQEQFRKDYRDIYSIVQRHRSGHAS